MSRILDSYGIGFGDLWATLQFAHRESMRTQEVVCISKWCGSLYDHDMTVKLTEMMQLIDSPTGNVLISDEKPNEHVGGRCWHTPYLPCVIRWRQPKTRRIACQFDGRSSAHIKNMPEEDSRLFTEWSKDKQRVDVGLPMTMRECAEAIASSDIFVGVCSGMSCLAISIGVPTFVLEYGVVIDWWYDPNKVIKCLGVSDFIRKTDALSCLSV